MAILKNASVPENARLWLPGKEAVTVSNQIFEERLKICMFRSIAEEMRERHLITEAEFRVISKKIDRMEIDLVTAKPYKEKRNRKLTEA